MGKIVQTAGRNTLGEFAPEFAHFNDDVLFGENWNNQDIDVKTRSIITVVALMASGITDSSLRYHLQNAKNHGVTQKEIAAVITHAAFYAGWPKAWAVFNLAKEVWETGEGDLPYEEEAMRAHAKEMVFPIGAPNDGFAQYFSGRSFLAPISTSQVGIFNVTFEPGCRNNWHIHHAKSGGGHINCGAFAMFAGMIIVPVVSLFTPKPNKELVDSAFACYEKEIEVPQKTALGK